MSEEGQGVPFTNWAWLQLNKTYLRYVRYKPHYPCSLHYGRDMPGYGVRQGGSCRWQASVYLQTLTDFGVPGEGRINERLPCRVACTAADGDVHGRFSTYECKPELIFVPCRISTFIVRRRTPTIRSHMHVLYVYSIY